MKQKSFLLLVEQRSPVYPVVHEHRNPPLNERLQDPPFRHGLGEHGSIPNRQYKKKLIEMLELNITEQ